MDHFSAKAKQLMKSRKLTYQETGERMGYPPSDARQAVYRFINGKNPSISMVAKFARALGVKVEELLKK